MGAFVLLLLTLFLTTSLGVLAVKLFDQERRDAARKTYRLTFPAELDAEQVVAWLRSISGTLRFSRLRIIGVPTVVFEMVATSSGIQHRLRVPWAHADYVIAQLRSLVPGIRVTPEEEFTTAAWARAVEVGLSHSSRQLRIPSPANTAASLLASVQALEEGETVLMQWVVSPTPPEHKPIYKHAQSDSFSFGSVTKGNMANRDEVHDRREKLEEPNVLAVLRVAAAAGTDARAQHLIGRVRAALAASRSPYTRFTKRWLSTQAVSNRVEHGAAPLVFPAQLSAPELSALIAWPIGNPFITGLPPALARQLPASELVPVEGRVIGRSNFPGNERKLAIGYTEARKHLHVIGPTGSGKTVLLSNLVKQDMDQDYGVIVIDGKGGASSLFATVLDLVPVSRKDDVIVLDVNDRSRPVGFNILQQGEPRAVVDELIALFEHLYGKDSVWTKAVLYHGLRTLVTNPRLTFVDLAPLLVPMGGEEELWRDDLLRSLKDKEIRQFWQRFEGQGRTRQDQIVQPVMDRIWQLNARPEIRNIIGQSQSAFQMRDVVGQGKILLVDISGIGKETASLTGTLLINALWSAVKSVPLSKPVYLYLDEFQNFLRLPIDPEDMLAQARGFGLGMTLAHQHLNQLPTELRSAVLANARSKIVFETTADDAAVLTREFGPSVSPHDFQHMGKYEAMARIATTDGVSPPLTFTASPPAAGYGKAEVVRYNSRQTYGRPVATVEQEIEARRRPAAQPEKANKPRRKSDWDDFPFQSA